MPEEIYDTNHGDTHDNIIYSTHVRFPLSSITVRSFGIYYIPPPNVRSRIFLQNRTTTIEKATAGNTKLIARTAG